MWFKKSAIVGLAIVLVSSPNVTRDDDLCAMPQVHRLPAVLSVEAAAGRALSGQREVKDMSVRIGEPKGQGGPLVEKYLVDGNLQSGETALLAHLKRHSSDDQSRFGLGVLQFLCAVERLAQDLYRYGVSDQTLNVPFVRLRVPPNPNPEVLSYRQTRNILRTFLDGLRRAEATLSQITDAEVKLPLKFGMIRLDLNGDGRADEGESLWKLYAGLSGNSTIGIEQAKQFYINFDRGDVHWLRGYCHLLMGMCEVYLAHDAEETFNCTGHLFFANVDSPYDFLAKSKHVLHRHDDSDLVDLIALIHLIRWPVIEPERMEAALHHLEAVAAQSKESWKWIMVESDDDHEWILNPKQTGVIPNARVTEEMVSAWIDMMDQAEKLLAGELLIPFWRGSDMGVNLRKVFTEPRTLDLVLWVQGPGAAPYLQRGQMTKPETWSRLQRVFGGEFTGFALWFN